MSKSLGIPGDVHNKKVSLLLEEVIKKGREYNKSIGTIATSKDHMANLIKLGLNFIVYLVDMHILFDSYKDINKSFINQKNTKNK